MPICKEELDNTVSAGGTVTLQELSIEPGCWRATESSENVLACFHAAACLGGVTGTAGYCLEGYEGPCECYARLTTVENMLLRVQSRCRQDNGQARSTSGHGKDALFRGLKYVCSILCKQSRTVKPQNAT